MAMGADAKNTCFRWGCQQCYENHFWSYHTLLYFAIKLFLKSGQKKNCLQPTPLHRNGIGCPKYIHVASMQFVLSVIIANVSLYFYYQYCLISFLFLYSCKISTSLPSFSKTDIASSFSYACFILVWTSLCNTVLTHFILMFNNSVRLWNLFWSLCMTCMTFILYSYSICI